MAGIDEYPYVIWGIQLASDFSEELKKESNISNWRRLVTSAFETLAINRNYTTKSL